MSELWINKWKPKNLDEIIGHKFQIKRISEWLNNLNNLKTQSLIISGKHGIGKRLVIKLILEKFGYTPIIINPNEIKDYRSCNNFEDYYNYTNSIFLKMNISKKNNKIALIFNESETITLTSEKKYILNIFKENNKKKSFPLIFISNTQHSKLLNDLKKQSLEIKLFTPSNYEIVKLIKKISKSENLEFKDDDLIDNIINFSQNDIRRLVNLLQDLSFHYKGKCINKKRLNKFFDNSKIKNIEIGLFDSTIELLNKKNSYDRILKLYRSEKVLLPLMIHENYQNKLKLNSENDLKDVLYKISKISDSISQGDNIETSIYTDQNWYLQNIHGFYTCVNSSFWINKNNDVKCNNVKFSSDLNKTSLKNINKKNINNLLKVINKKSISEILILTKISNFLIKNKREKELIDILKNYNKDISIKEIELCLKIDKTFDFHKLSTKEKKNIVSQI